MVELYNFRVGKEVVRAETLEEAYRSKGLTVPSMLRCEDVLSMSNFHFGSGRRSNGGKGENYGTSYFSPIPASQIQSRK
jgi:hypothetical protein